MHATHISTLDGRVLYAIWLPPNSQQGLTRTISKFHLDGHPARICSGTMDHPAVPHNAAAVGSSSSASTHHHDEEDVFFDADSMAPTLQNVINQASLRMIFVGGKGGVGKTTISCALATQLALVRPNVLIISTDPAHNISDAFGQQFAEEPKKVFGFDNLFAMEVEPTNPLNSTARDADSLVPEADRGMFDVIKNMASSMPGIDEVTSFLELMKYVQTVDYSVIVFDTAPTGHTLRLLQFPQALEQTFGVFNSAGPLGGLVNSMGQMLGLPSDLGDMSSRMSERRQTGQEIQRMFQDRTQTTFVCVCIAEFLSIYETERLIQELMKHGIDCHNIVVNQLLYPEDRCRMCTARNRIQQKYLEQINDLYRNDFHITRVPLFPSEIRGPEAIRQLGELLLQPQRPPPCPPEESTSSNRSA